MEKINNIISTDEFINNRIKSLNITEKEYLEYDDFCSKYSNCIEQLSYEDYKKLQEIKQENNLTNDNVVCYYKYKEDMTLKEFLTYLKMLDKCKNFDDDKLNKIKSIRHFIKNKDNETIPNKYKNAKLDDFKENSDEEKIIKKDVIEYLDNALEHYIKPTSIFFYGNYGTGKTMLMSIMARELSSKYGFKTIFTDTSNLVNNLFKSYNDTSLNGNEMLETIANADFLCLDDFDQIKVTDHIKEKMYYIIDYRYSNELPIFISSNSDLQKLDYIYGEAIISRLYETSKMLEFKQKNYRLRK